MFECREHRKLYDKIESFLEHLEREHKDVFQKLLSWLAKNGYNKVEPPAITINIYGAGNPRETGEAVIDALRRSGVI